VVTTVVGATLVVAVVLRRTVDDDTTEVGTVTTVVGTVATVVGTVAIEVGTVTTVVGTITAVVAKFPKEAMAAALQTGLFRTFVLLVTAGLKQSWQLLASTQLLGQGWIFCRYPYPVSALGLIKELQQA